MHPGQGYGNAARMSRERQDIENERRKIEREITESRVGYIYNLFDIMKVNFCSPLI